MLFRDLPNERRISRKFLTSLIAGTDVINHITTHYLHPVPHTVLCLSGSTKMREQVSLRWIECFVGRTMQSFSAPTVAPAMEQRELLPMKTFVHSFCEWLHSHEEAQVALASLLVVLCAWWTLRTVITLLINLLFPMLLVLAAVICVPSLRQPLLGQNYPVVINLVRNILYGLAENLRPD